MTSKRLKTKTLSSYTHEESVIAALLKLEGQANPYVRNVNFNLILEMQKAKPHSMLHKTPEKSS